MNMYMRDIKLNDRILDEWVILSNLNVYRIYHVCFKLYIKNAYVVFVRSLFARI